MSVTKVTKPRSKRYSVSVSGLVYDRLNMVLSPSASLQKFVNGIVAGALDDPAIRDRVLKKCLAKYRAEDGV
jgi:hypothetical protein